MQIVIPMSGFGERFRAAGYLIPKPLIEINGKPIIAHVIDMFPGESNFIFICSNEHLENSSYRMREILHEYCPTGQIIGIHPHKLGPIYAVMQAEHLINLDLPTIVNYCDFTCYWNWNHFKEFVEASECVGAIPAYKGFHPHSLGNTNYAYMLEQDGWLKGIQEKRPYTENRMEEYASSGTYFFSSGKIMIDAFKATVDRDINVNGEYYVSLAYNILLQAGRGIAVYPLQHFMQWGTPEDVVEFSNWSAVFKSLISLDRLEDRPSGSLIVPMAGLGKRFSQEGYVITKPLIPVSGRAMVLQAANDLPPAKNHAFVLRRDMPGYEECKFAIEEDYPDAIIQVIPGITQGQACTALVALDALTSEIGELSGPFTFGACDNGVLYSANKFQALVENPEIDLIVWCVRGHVNALRYPHMFGWVDALPNGRINHISVKTPLGSPKSDPIVIGTFTFKLGADFRKAVNRLVARDGRINGEFYIDSCINDAIDLGLNCHMFEVDSFISWGTPNDLRTFEYWQSCFHKWNGHPYRLDKDYRIPPNKVAALANRYRATVPQVPS